MGDSFIGTGPLDPEAAELLAESIRVPVNRFADWPAVSTRVVEVGEALRKASIGRRYAWNHPLKDTKAGEVLAGLPTEDLRAAGLWAMLYRWTGGTDRTHLDLCNAVTDVVAVRRLAWTAREISVLLDCAARYRNSYHLPVVLKLPVSAAARLGDDELRALREPILAARTRAAECFEDMNPDRRGTTVKQLEQLAGRLGHEADDLPAMILNDLDAFGPRVREALGERVKDRALIALLKHAVGVSSGARPTASWRKQAARLVAEPVHEAVRQILTVLVAHREELVVSPSSHGDYGFPVYLDGGNLDMARGLVWAVATLDAAWVPSLLGDLAVTAAVRMAGGWGELRSERLVNAAIGSLGERADDAAVAQLSRIRSRLRRKTMLKSVDKALSTVAERGGISRERLLDRTVPDYGLDADGVRSEAVGEHTAVLALTDDGVSLVFADAAGRRLAGVPMAVRADHADVLADLRREVKELKQMLPTQRFRIEEALGSGRVWDGAEWRAYCLEHPVTGRITRALIWEISTDGGASWRAGLPAEGELSMVDGGLLVVPADARVRLWHPVRADRDEVAAWRDRFAEERLRQPFKQAYREIYLLTPAEESTHDHSNRFAAHVLRYGQARALLTSRGWSAPSLGYWDGGYEGAAVRVYRDEAGGAEFRASFDVTLIATETDGGNPALCSTGRVHFTLDGVSVALRDIPALVLSEAFRDCDLAVGVTSIATDPTWADTGRDSDHWDYWSRASTADLGAAAQIRREALRRLLPRTKIADRVEIGDRFVRVRGNKRTFKVHIGSGNILMEPNDSYLCIVAKPHGGKQLFLPFEEADGMLGVILSKVFLLAADDKITDPTITRQLV
ncbi:DUF4132 domain-containing protein [Phytomonospora endophytica]|uniref:DUF4132 domain-containing protein n=1 Tax=Phytomonospora endophytica TaxID=714109 RepID=A0A841FE16_9ACTN|nr:DUF4132 domain-containing protein [Phytomonospora endophytica]MBB6034506.1 hypothetical protein [Phytomonospora endophytica]GIG70413.1 hypothetical protein Pen01_67080 [Phytomonospora endophytica]